MDKTGRVGKKIWEFSKPYEVSLLEISLHIQISSWSETLIVISHEFRIT